MSQPGRVKMITGNKMVFVAIFLLLLLPAATVDNQNIEVTITGLRNSEGQIVLGVFADQESFKREQSYREFRFSKKDIRGSEMKVQFTIPPGTYGFAILDDETGDGFMQYNFLGMPKEGFGFSDYYHQGLTMPKFDDFKFVLAEGQKKSVNVRIRYIL
jgi:uncharacterized protein (DUF2141 family)